MEKNEEIEAALKFFKVKKNSKVQEQYAEYRFLSDLILEAASREKKVNIVRGDFDAFGSDVLLEWDGKVWIVQLKTKNSAQLSWDIHKTLLNNPNGKVVLITYGNWIKDKRFDENLPELEYKIFKDSCKENALDTYPLHPKKDSDKKNLPKDKYHECQVKYHQFELLYKWNLIDKLFK